MTLNPLLIPNFGIDAAFWKIQLLGVFILLAGNNELRGVNISRMLTETPVFWLRVHIGTLPGRVVP